MITFQSNTFAVEAAGPDGENRRTITGIAVPYNTFATVSDGTTVQFMPGSLPVKGKAPKLYMNHDSTQAIGLVAERVDSEEAMYFTAKVSNTRAGVEALVLAADGVIDSVSVGVNPTEFKYDDEGNMTILAAEWVELSLVPTPAFAGARRQGLVTPNRLVASNVLIALGTLVLSASGTLAGRFGEERAFTITLSVGVVILFVGFLVPSARSTREVTLPPCSQNFK